jgi:hypothetical protein
VATFLSLRQNNRKKELHQPLNGSLKY